MRGTADRRKNQMGMRQQPLEHAEQPGNHEKSSQVSRSVWSGGKSSLSRWGFTRSSIRNEGGHEVGGKELMAPSNTRLPSAFCATPKPSTSSNSVRTSSPSPRLSKEDEGAMPSPGFWLHRTSRRGMTGDAERNTVQTVRAKLPTQTEEVTAEIQSEQVIALHDRQEQQQEKSIWTDFVLSSSAGGIAGGYGRELQRRQCVFNVFVVFRGGWCSASSGLLRGEWSKELYFIFVVQHTRRCTV